MYFGFISPSPCLSHAVFKDNRGDQSFKIHNSTQTWRKKHSRNKVRFSQGWETAKMLQISRAFLPFSTPWLMKCILQIPCYKYKNSSWGFLPLLNQFVPQYLLMLVIASVKGQDLAPGLVQLREVHLAALFQPVQAHTGTSVKLQIIHFFF